MQIRQQQQAQLQAQFQMQQMQQQQQQIRNGYQTESTLGTSQNSITYSEEEEEEEEEEEIIPQPTRFGLINLSVNYFNLQKFMSQQKDQSTRQIGKELLQMLKVSPKIHLLQADQGFPPIKGG